MIHALEKGRRWEELGKLASDLPGTGWTLLSKQLGLPALAISTEKAHEWYSPSDTTRDGGPVLQRIPGAYSFAGVSRIGVFLVLILLIAACGGEIATSGPTASPTPRPSATTVPTPAQIETPAPTPLPTLGSTPVGPISTPEPTSLSSLPPTLELITPEDGAGVEVDAVRVMGIASVDAAVDVNGFPVEISADGSFQLDLDLEEGANLIEVVATNLEGAAAFQERVVFFISTAAGLPFTLFYPTDGLVVSEPEIEVTGGTRPEAVVGVNGVPVDVNRLGIFSTSITLEEGGNFIEVLATDIDGSVRIQTVAVFYLP